MRIVTWLLTNAVSLAAATWLFEGIRFTGATDGQAEFQDKTVPLLIVALILGTVTALVKPVVTLLSLPLVLLTLGLFLLVINAAMLKLTAWLADLVDLGFTVTGFWPAVGGAIVITVVTWITDAIVGSDD